MCLFAKKKSQADSDIICYKVGIPMENGMTSPYMGFPFLFNKEYVDEAPEELQELEGKKLVYQVDFFTHLEIRNVLKRKQMNLSKDTVDL